MELKKVKQFVDFFNKSGLGELEVEFDKDRIKSIKAKRVQSSSVKSIEGIDIAPSFEYEDEAEGNEVVSPLVGTFYTASGPDADDFCKVGDIVKEGQTLCIVEAMKVMNEITAPFDGRVEKVLVQNEEVVGFDQPLFILSDV
jgi:acetyl-CoA carboxylase biotin carboxyl carrier protein